MITIKTLLVGLILGDYLYGADNEIVTTSSTAPTFLHTVYILG